MAITTSTHGTHAGRDILKYTLSNAEGTCVEVSEIGASIISFKVPTDPTDPSSEPVELTITHRNFADWLSNDTYLGATCGRVGNRIAHGRCKVRTKELELATNNAPADIPCHLHGGPTGFSAQVWQSSIVGDSVVFTLDSPDGHEGYPGNLSVRVVYSLSDDSTLQWHASAICDQATPINLINHTYWNLSGDPTQSIEDHEAKIHADFFLPTNAGMIPTGEVRPVADSPMDFNDYTPIGARIRADYEPLTLANGYDHCYVLRQRDPDAPILAATVKHPCSGRYLQVSTNQPGVQFYSGNFLPQPRTGFCLETQSFPDAVNHQHFPNTILHKGHTYQHSLHFRYIAPKA